MSGQVSRSRWIAWVILGLPLVVYAVFWPVRARLDRGVIERRTAGSIWQTMSRSLPETDPQVVFEIVFWFGCAVFMAGALYLVWLALAADGAAVDEHPGDHRGEPLADLDAHS